MDGQNLLNVLQAIPWFQELSVKHLEKLMEISSLMETDANQNLFKEGDLEDFIYIVIQGRVAIEMSIGGQERMRIYTAEPMDIVGWSSLTLVVRRRTASAQAVLPSCLVQIDAAKLRQLCDEDCDLGYVIMKRVANVVASRLLTTRLQLTDMFANPEEGKNA